MIRKFVGIIGVAVAVAALQGCNAVYMPPADPGDSDLTKEQAMKIAKRKIHVPCRVEVHCSDSLVGYRDSLFFTDSYYYPLKAILSNSFTNAAYQVFDAPGGEILDAFTVHVTVPESNLDIAWGDANYVLQVIVRLDEPGEKRITAFSVQENIKMPVNDGSKVQEPVYIACRNAAFSAMEKILKSPKLWRTVKRFEER